MLLAGIRTIAQEDGPERGLSERDKYRPAIDSYSPRERELLGFKLRAGFELMKADGVPLEGFVRYYPMLANELRILE